jgi:hypothetical protein
VGNIQGGAHYLAICSEEVMADIMSVSSGLWVSVAQYQNAKAIYNAEVGQLLGFRFVTTNFIPRFEILGNTTAAVASGAGGGITGFTITAGAGGSGTLAQATTYFWKIVRKDRTRGFSELITIEHSTATTGAGGATQFFTFALPSSTDYAYDIFFGSSTGDSNLKLVSTGNHIGGTTVTVNAVSSSTTTAPANVNATGTPDIHPIYFFGKKATAWVGLQELQTFVTGDKAEKSDPLNQVQTMGYKFMGKTVILDQSRLLRLEVATGFAV